VVKGLLKRAKENELPEAQEVEQEGKQIEKACLGGTKERLMGGKLFYRKNISLLRTDGSMLSIDLNKVLGDVCPDLIFSMSLHEIRAVGSKQRRVDASSTNAGNHQPKSNDSNRGRGRGRGSRGGLGGPLGRGTGISARGAFGSLQSRGRGRGRGGANANANANPNAVPVGKAATNQRGGGRGAFGGGRG
jgi:hypothetical protein